VKKIEKAIKINGYYRKFNAYKGVIGILLRFNIIENI
jgi:hypothetical protein